MTQHIRVAACDCSRTAAEPRHDERVYVSHDHGPSRPLPPGVPLQPARFAAVPGSGRGAVRRHPRRARRRDRPGCVLARACVCPLAGYKRVDWLLDPPPSLSCRLLQSCLSAGRAGGPRTKRRSIALWSATMGGLTLLPFLAFCIPSCSCCFCRPGLRGDPVPYGHERPDHPLPQRHPGRWARTAWVTAT